jgi:hypothetical protein
MRNIRLSLILSLFSLTLTFPCASAAEVFCFPTGRNGHGELKYVNGLPVLVVAGTPEEMGTAVGLLALKPGVRTLDYPRDLLKTRAAEKTWDLFIKGGHGMFQRFPIAYQQELEAMVKSAGVPRDPVIAGNTFFDLKKFLACSAILVESQRSATGGPLLGRNLDYPSLGYIHQYSLVTVYRPTGKHAFVSIGFPGLVGCLSGMNDAGLAVAVLEVFDVKSGEPSFNANGIPYALCYRQLLEECTTIAEAQKRLERLPRTATTNLVLADRSGIAVLEVTPKRVLRRNPEQGLCACTNHFCLAALKPEQPANVDRSFERFATLAKVRSWRDRLRPEGLRKHLDAVNLGDLTLQTMVFDPAALQLHLSIGNPPASAGILHTIDLAPLFQASDHKASR